MEKHIVKSYDRELEQLSGKISDMGRIARMQFDTVLEAFINKDTESAKNAEIARDMLGNILEAYVESDIQKALDVRGHDLEIDKLYATRLIRLRVCMMNDTDTVKTCTALLFVSRCLERIGDHIKNVAEDIYFIVTGEIYNGDQSNNGDQSGEQN